MWIEGSGSRIGVEHSALNFRAYPNPVPPSAYAVLISACQRDAARPRLTWYDNETGERVELSGATLLNWVHKTANFMIDELFVEPGVSISLQLPRHWLTAVWWLAAHAVGSQPQLAPPSNEPPVGSFDVAVFGPKALEHLAGVDGSAPSSGAAWAQVEHRVAVALTPMATGFVGRGQPLPAGIIDFETEVRGQPDAFIGNDEGTPAVAEAAIDHARRWSLTSNDRVMAAGPLGGEDDLVRELLAPLAADASCVWIRNPDAGKDVQHAAAEHVTATTMTAAELPDTGNPDTGSPGGPIRSLT